jgi:hypothetical protein
MPIIVGAPRSGTTLLRFMLDAHPALAIPPETGFLPAIASLPSDAEGAREAVATITAFPPDAPAWPDYGLDASAFRRVDDVQRAAMPAGVVRAFYRSYAARFGKARWGDKTPTYCRHVAAIGALLPEAHFIHVIRDGRDAAESIKSFWFSPGKEVEVRAAFWRDCVRAARSQAAQVQGRYLEVRYEQLLEATEPVLQTIGRFLELPYDPAMLDYHLRASMRLAEHGDRVRSDGALVVSRAARLQQQALTTEPPQRARAGAWRTTMAASERERFEAVAGDLLRELGYEEPATEG